MSVTPQRPVHGPTGLQADHLHKKDEHTWAPLDLKIHGYYFFWLLFLFTQKLTTFVVLVIMIVSADFMNNPVERWIIHGPRPTQPNPSYNEADAVRLIRPKGIGYLHINADGSSAEMCVLQAESLESNGRISTILSISLGTHTHPFIKRIQFLFHYFLLNNN